MKSREGYVLVGSGTFLSDSPLEILSLAGSGVALAFFGSMPLPGSLEAGSLEVKGVCLCPPEGAGQAPGSQPLSSSQPV